MPMKDVIIFICYLGNNYCMETTETCTLVMVQKSRSICNIIQILVQQLLCCSTKIWYCSNFRYSLIYTSPQSILWSYFKIRLLNPQLPVLKRHLWGPHTPEIPAACTELIEASASSQLRPYKKVAPVGREGSLSIPQGIKRLWTSSFGASWLDAGNGGQAGLLAAQELGWIGSPASWCDLWWQAGGHTEGLEAPAEPSGSAIKPPGFSESNLQWVSNLELF